MKFTSVMAMLCLSMPCLMTAAPLSFPNPSFEDVAPGTSWPRSWLKHEDVQGEIVTEKAAHGSKAMRFTQGYFVLTHDFTIDNLSGQTITVTAQSKGAPGMKFGLILGYLLKHDDGGQEWSNNMVIWDYELTQDWQTITSKTTLPDNISGTRLYVGFYRLGGKGAIWLDNLTINGTDSKGKAPMGAEIPGKPTDQAHVLCDSVPQWPKGTGKTAEFRPLVPSTVPCLDQDSTVQLTLPPVIYALTGVETRIYYHNLILSLSKKLCDISIEAPFGQSEERYWSAIPTTPGDYPLTVTVTDRAKRELGKARTILRVTDVKKGNDRNLVIMMVGDSFMSDAGIPGILWDNLKQHGNPNVRLMGSHSGSGAPLALDKAAVEAYGGWSWKTFMTYWEPGNNSGDKTKFMKRDGSGKLVFALQEYLDHYNQGQPPDVVIFFLGCNDIACSKPMSLPSSILNSGEHRWKLLREFHRVMPRTRIGIALLPPPNENHAAFQSNYGDAINRTQYTINQFLYMKQTIEEFHQNDEFSLIPTYVAVDELKGYPGANNALHHNTYGRKQLAQVFEAWLKGNLK